LRLFYPKVVIICIKYEEFITKVAIYGGSFDPPHLGHIAVIEAALNELNIDKLIIIPTFINPFKEAFTASSQQRLLWIQEICTHYDKAEVSDIEVVSQKKMATFETLTHLKLRYNFTHKPYLIIGADNLSGLPSWSHFDALSKEVKFVIAKRKNFDLTTRYLTLDIDVDVSSSDLRSSMDITKVPDYLSNDILKTYKEHNDKS